MAIKGPTIRATEIGAQGNANHDQNMTSAKGAQFDHLPASYAASKGSPTPRSEPSPKTETVGKGKPPLPNKTYDHLPNGRGSGPMRV